MLKRLISPPVFDDQEHHHTALQLWRVVTVMVVMTVIYLVAWLILSPDISIRVLFALPLFPLYMGEYYLIRMGRLRTASGLLVWGIWLVLLVAAGASGGVLAPGFGGLLIAVLAAGIFLGRNWALIVASASVAAGGVLVYLDRLGYLQDANQYVNSTTMWLAEAVFFFIAASLLQTATRRIANALHRAERELEERRKTEAKLREAEKQYRDLVEKVPAVIYVAEPGAEGNWTYVSPRIEALTGYPAEEWLADQHLWFSRIHPDDRDSVLENEKIALREGRHYQSEYRFTCRDGTVIWIRDESLNLPDDFEGVKMVQGILLDVTRRKQAEEELQANQSLLTAILENIPFDFWANDSNDRFVLQNSISRSLAGNLIGKTVEDLDIPDALLQKYKNQHQRALQGETLREEVEFVKDGRKAYALNIHAPIWNNSTITGLIGMTIDTTEQHRAQEALRDAELLYRTLVEETSVVLYRDAAEEGGPSLFISPQIEKLIGYSVEELSQSPLYWQTLVHPDDLEGALKVVHEVVTSGENRTSEYRLRSKTGEWVWVRDESVAVKDENGKLLFVQGVYLNITRQKQVEAQREALIKELESKNSELERFTYTVSHDLKAPLITMSGFLGYLEADATSGNVQRLRSDIQRILEANQKMQRLLNELLELSRVGRLINAPETIPFRQIVDEALSRVEGRLSAGKVQVVVMENLPTVHADRIRIVEVVQNLLDNAAKFMGDQPAPRVEVGAETLNGETIFFVRDNGIGIEPRFHQKVFDLFDKLNPGIEGTGIGLALVKRIVELHGGRVWVESTPGMGATFRFTLPGAAG